MKIRPATPEDVPAVARIVLTALRDEAPWKAFFPRMAETDPEYVEYCEAILQSYFAPANKNSWLFLVVEISAAEARLNPGPMIVAAAVWDISTSLGHGQGHKGRQSNTAAPMDLKQNHGPVFSQDNIPAKPVALSQAVSDGRRRHFSNHVPYIFLHILATRPDYQRQGYGKALCNSGINLAKQKHASVCVQTAPRGYVLFSGLGFADQGPIALPAEPDADGALVKAMVLDSHLIQRRSSILYSLMRYITG
ncbi:Acyl-CoA N-acyltransferase [Metarhizium album ARSEF 1941]|uniref:Acyl-CoA N-acyltransferase n=1 Tax=Metarhizium album (strain ARSEF 1941) TaxID=1081103 RepID=A0A0B2X3T6_METAS|nr:Acyl-CoA N-acyltransferase [Metarhizium album ARSEF 1941]KHO00413.1 Acyl-CoA N-acyltransferase [Metarhizium album ARSEF 1941]